MQKFILMLGILVLAASAALAQPQRAVPVDDVEEIVLSDIGAQPDPQVAELFTSPACGFCPKAKDILGKLNERPSIIAYICPVDYFKTESGFCKDRQNFYAGTLRSGPAYTPQVVLDGQDDVIGSQEDLVNEALATPQNVKAKRVKIQKAKLKNVYKISFPQIDSGKSIQTQVVFLRGKADEKLKTFDRADPLMEWDGSAQALEVEILMKKEQSGFLILAQDETSGTIFAAGEFAR